jgi:tRNA(fMet)-specific endonuclease VapC
MPQLYLLDTNTASHVITAKVPRVRERLATVPMSQVAISVITEAELRFGLEKKPEAHKLRIAVEDFLLALTILPWNSDAAKAYAKVRFSTETSGQPMGGLDMMIAAQALSARAILVTSDAGFRKLKGLELEDWTK